MTLEKMAGVAVVLALNFAGGLVRGRWRGILEMRVMQCSEMAFFVLNPVSGSAKASTCGQNIGDENRKQHVNEPRFDA